LTADNIGNGGQFVTHAYKRLNIMKALIVALLFILAPMQNASAEYTVALGADFVHVVGKPYGEVRYFGEKYPFWSTYVATDMTVGVDAYFTVKNLQLGLGMEYSSEYSTIVETKLGYQLRAEYVLSNTWAIGVKHRSNCKKLCDNKLLNFGRIGKTGTNNTGYNFLYVRYSFNK